MILIKFLIITIIVIWIIRTVLRLVFPVILRKAFGAAQNQAQQHQAQQNQYQKKSDGSISIDYMPKTEKKGNSDKLGDFVDYEEVK